MNQRIKTLWLHALRSGEYTQAKNSLRKGDSFCCLGVLCDLAAKEGIGEWSKTPQPGLEGLYKDTDYFFGKDYDYSFLPENVSEWAEVNSRNPFIHGNINESLSFLNDSNNKFEGIANMIEKYL